MYSESRRTIFEFGRQTQTRQKRFNNGWSKSTGKPNTKNKKPRGAKQQVAKCKTNTTKTELEGRLMVSVLFGAKKLAVGSSVQIKEGQYSGRFGVVQEAGGSGRSWKVRLELKGHSKPHKRWPLHAFEEEELQLVDEKGRPQLQYYAAGFEPHAMDPSVITLYKEIDLGVKLGTLDSNGDYYDYVTVFTTGKEAKRMGIKNKKFYNVQKGMIFKRPSKGVGGKLQWNDNKHVENQSAKLKKKLESLKKKLADDPTIPASAAPSPDPSLASSDPGSSEDEADIVIVVEDDEQIGEVNRQIAKEQIAKTEKSLKNVLAGSELQLELKEASVIEFCEADNMFLKAIVEMSSGRMEIAFGWIHMDNDVYYSKNMDVSHYVYGVDKLHYVSSPQPSYADKECPKCIEVNKTLDRNEEEQNDKKTELEKERDLPALRKALKEDPRTEKIKQLKQRIKDPKFKPNCTRMLKQRVQKLQKDLKPQDLKIKTLEAEVKKAMEIFRRDEVPYNYGIDKIKGTCVCQKCKDPGCPISNGYVAMQVVKTSVDKCAVLSLKARDRRCSELSFALSKVHLAVKIHARKVREKSRLEEEEGKLRLALKKEKGGDNKYLGEANTTYISPDGPIIEWADLPSQSSFAALDSGNKTLSWADEVERLNDGVREAEIRDQLKKNQQRRKRLDAEVRDLREKMNRRKEVFGAKIPIYDHVLLPEGRERERQTEFNKLWAKYWAENKERCREMRKAMQHVGSKRGAGDDDKEEARRRHDEKWLEYNKMTPTEVLAIFEEQCNQFAAQSTISNQKSADADKFSTSSLGEIVEEEKRNFLVSG